MTDRPDNALLAHGRDCDDCRSAPLPIAPLVALLDAAAVEVDAERLSRLALARVAPELRARAQTSFWRRLVRALGAALLPLPLLVGADLWLLGRFYDLAAAWLPSSLAAYFVLSYAASLLVLIGSVYAAIPLLLAHRVLEPDAAPA